MDFFSGYLSRSSGYKRGITGRLESIVLLAVDRLPTRGIMGNLAGEKGKVGVVANPITPGKWPRPGLFRLLEARSVRTSFLGPGT